MHRLKQDMTEQLKTVVAVGATSIPPSAISCNDDCGDGRTDDRAV